MTRKIIDLSVPIEHGLPSDPEMMIPQVEYINHQMGAEQMEQFFPGLAKKDLPGGLGWAVESLNLTSHSGTHLDAPFHYHPTMDGGKPSLTIDEVPLEWCFSDGVVLDFSTRPDGYGITTADVEAELERIGYELKPMDIVLVRSGAATKWGQAEYLVSGCGMTRQSTLYLLERGVRVVGIDAWSWDRPLPFQAKDFGQTGDASLIWEAHFAGIERGYCHMEKMYNLESIPKPFGFKVACFPIKIKDASGAWCRPVAILED